MEGFDLLHATEWKPLAAFGFINPFFSIDAHIVTNTWILLGILFVCLILIRFFVLKKHSMLRFLILSFINSFIDLCQQTLGFFSFEHFCFITAIFTFILFANCLMLIPFLEEPTKNINTTLSLGIIAFFYIQTAAI
ncbi:MAG TPA: F0F1 ATP synthase subunit A, partial [Candidatus Babeliales bacterium]|nr:F0F1 ATP synthase subunit A [Candidatus Babeliales bacterium]